VSVQKNNTATTGRKRKMESQIKWLFFVAPKPLDMWLNKGENVKVYF
jgi:hypothetical protein